MAKKSEENKPETAVSVGHRDASQLMNPGSEKHQSMSGFDDDYVDIVDYIVRSTHKIWEEGGIGRIYDHYRHNAIIHTTDGTTYGRDKVIADSLKTMAAFPDIRLFADDVIWSGNDKDGFHSSHRITWVGRNTGYSIYGPPTGKRVVRQGVAHCFVYENRVVEEWICRDELALIRQLGFDEVALAKKMAAQAATDGVQLPSPGQGEVARLQGQTTPAPLPQPDAMHEVEFFVRRAIHEIWNWRRLDKISDYYAENYKGRTATDRQLFGWGDFKAYVLGLLAAFSDTAVTVDHVCWIPDQPNGWRVATRWLLQGTHDGPGIYGDPTGKRIRLWGISHHQIKDGRIAQEWTVFDEFALLKQLYSPNTPTRNNSPETADE